jgi:beta-aspartyl-peptidase (threonine type)
MTFADRRLLLLVALIAVLVAARARSSPGRGRDGAVERAVRGVLDEQVACWNRGDLDAFADTYWKSPELVFQSGGDRNLGWDAMRERYRKRYEGEGKAMGRLTFDRLEVRPLGDDAAYAFGAWALEMPDGSQPSGLFTVILRERPEGWRIVHDHTSSANP